MKVSIFLRTILLLLPIPLAVEASPLDGAEKFAGEYLFVSEQTRASRGNDCPLKARIELVPVRDQKALEEGRQTYENDPPYVRLLFDDEVDDEGMLMSPASDEKTLRGTGSHFFELDVSKRSISATAWPMRNSVFSPEGLLERLLKSGSGQFIEIHALSEGSQIRVHFYQKIGKFSSDLIFLDCIFRKVEP